MSPFSLQINCFFVITNRSNLHRDRRIPTKWKHPHTVTLWEEFCRDGCASAGLAPAVFWGTAAPFLPLGSNTLPGTGCQASVCKPFFLSPAHSPCYKMQLLLFWHFTHLVLLNSLSPTLVVLFSLVFLASTVCSTGYHFAHHLPIQNHCDDLHSSPTDPLQATYLHLGPGLCNDFVLLGTTEC